VSTEAKIARATAKRGIPHLLRPVVVTADPS
jgi:hypothetical protein